MNYISFYLPGILKGPPRQTLVTSINKKQPERKARAKEVETNTNDKDLRNYNDLQKDIIVIIIIFICCIKIKFRKLIFITRCNRNRLY